MHTSHGWGLIVSVRASESRGECARHSNCRAPHAPRTRQRAPPARAHMRLIQLANLIKMPDTMAADLASWRVWRATFCWHTNRFKRRPNGSTKCTCFMLSVCVLSGGTCLLADLTVNEHYRDRDGWFDSNMCARTLERAQFAFRSRLSARVGVTSTSHCLVFVYHAHENKHAHTRPKTHSIYH